MYAALIVLYVRALPPEFSVIRLARVYSSYKLHSFKDRTQEKNVK